ncbi:helix-turn-helix transcriptional regulator [Cytobacillus gottheilii]|uniref:helix-turn-helix transcriptional regulator n=1 Tax=Cytobacillus gottheilii TaxID=859144 RepID=UPI0009BAA737|nr:helix-turn-helix domain-containing protein [Cytobacillus gottheilii]
MEQTLKITNVLSDPTRYYIYQYITEKHRDVTVQEIADHFSIHPNVARLHLSKLEDVNMIISETKKTGKGGRPSRLYRLSDEVIQLQFPFRDYKLLSEIALETLLSLGEAGKAALYATGKKFGQRLMEQENQRPQHSMALSSFDQKLNIIKNAADLAGFHPEFEVNEDETSVYFQIYNCPFKEIAANHPESVCHMHYEFLNGMFSSVFPNMELKEKSNMLKGCDFCSYQSLVTN